MKSKMLFLLSACIATMVVYGVDDYIRARYMRPVYSGVSDIWHPSDHRPILVNLDF